MTKTVITLIVLLCGGLGGLLFRQLKGTTKTASVQPLTPQSIDELAASYSKKVDQLIVKEVEKTGNQFVSGIFTIKNDSSEKMEIVADLYYQDQSENWLHQKNQDFLPMNTLDEAGRSELQTHGELQFDVEMPEQLVSTSEIEKEATS